MAIVDAPPDIRKRVAKAKSLTPITVLGSGVIFDRTGLVLTAKHVLDPYMKGIQEAQAGARPPLPNILIPRHQGLVEPDVYQWGFLLAPIERLTMSNTQDVAAVSLGKIPPHIGSLPALPLSSEPCQEGDEIVACGFPFGLTLHEDLAMGTVTTSSFSSGIVSTTIPYPGAPRELSTVFQMDAIFNGGNSGGPVCDARTGRVVGIAISSIMCTAQLSIPNARDPLKFETPTGLSRVLHIHVAEEITRLIRAPLAQPPTPL